MENPKRNYFMYVLLCEDHTLYTGYTTDVQKRFQVHQAGKGAKYTRTHYPIKVLFQKQFATKHDALSAEYFFKKLSRKQKLYLIHYPELFSIPGSEWLHKLSDFQPK
ncbi:GIY-YIG nuclease family protein [Lentilactobacillus raoultii]|uniref:GIY-YIG nuclease family protein n=1 Tax=Lentilactobacillus raoultii TaxID=1987503 RepID=A0ABW3PFJ8_9LACO|nr:GIY-YIG nuclease family protein [Lentilactobacillus raoultii]